MLRIVVADIPPSHERSTYVRGEAGMKINKCEFVERPAENELAET